MRSKRAAGYIGAGLVPLRVSGDGVAAISALTEEQVTAFDGFSRLAAPVGAGRLVLVFGGPLDTVRDVLAWPDAVEGAEYYLSLTGPVLRSELTEATWSRLVGIGQAGGSIVTRVGPAFEYSAEADPFVPSDEADWDTSPVSDGAALDELASRVSVLEDAVVGVSPETINSYRSTATYPATAAVHEHLDLTGDGGDVFLPASEGLDVMSACRIRQMGTDIEVKTSDGATIDGDASLPYAGTREHYKFVWNGAEWMALDG